MNKILGIIKCVVVMIAFLLMQYAVIFAAYFVVSLHCFITDKNDKIGVNVIDNNILMISVIGQFISLVVFGLLYYFKCYKKEVKKTNKSYNAKNIIGVCLLGFGLQVVINFVIGLIGMVFPDLVTQYVNVVKDSGIDQIGFFSVLSTVVLAPLLEETVFRGWIIHIAKKDIKKPIALVFISASLFGIMHLIPLQVIYAFLLGLIIAGVYVKHESLFLCILIHLVFNASSYVYMVIQEYIKKKNEAVGSLVLLVGSIILTAIGAILVLKKDKNVLNDVDSYILDKKTNEKKSDDINNTVRINTDEIENEEYYASHENEQ